MEVKDLKVGMICQLKSGTLMQVQVNPENGNKILIGTNTFLEYIQFEKVDDCSVIKVMQPDRIVRLIPSYWRDSPVIWEYKEPRTPYKIGDTVKVIDGGTGAMGCNGETGVILFIDSKRNIQPNHGLTRMQKGIVILISEGYGSCTWKVNCDFEYEVIGGE
jgi:hypothetical protein